MSAATPQHEHDCSTCVFLGRDGEYDLYFHKGAHPLFTTVVARFGERGDYLSGLCFATGDSPLAEAKRRAEEAGYSEEIRKATGG